MIKKKTTKSSTAKVTQGASARSSRQNKQELAKRPAGGGIWLRGLFFALFTVVLLAALVLAGIMGYREYSVFKGQFASLEGQLVEAHTERSLLQSEMQFLEQRLQLTDKELKERLSLFDEAFKRLNSQEHLIRRLESFVYLAERERVLGRSPRRILDLLLQAREDLPDLPENFVLLDALNRDLETYEVLAREGTDRVFYQLRLLANQTRALPLVPSSLQEAARVGEGQEETQGEKESWLSKLGDYVRLYRYNQDDQFTFFRDRNSLDLVKLLLEVHLLQAERSAWVGEEQFYRLSLNQYLIKLRYYYPPNSERRALEDKVGEVKQLDFPSLPPLNIVRILPEYR